jgi:uncharacterized protein (DUF302 family)
MRMSRYWISGCMAVILAAAGRMPDPDDTTRSSSKWVSLKTHLSVKQAVAQIEALAREGQTPVLVRTSAAGRALKASAGTGATVLVLGDAAGQTPVVQAQGDQLPDLPLGIVISRTPDGLTQVRYAEPEWVAAGAQRQSDVPPDWQARIRALPGLIKSALA